MSLDFELVGRRIHDIRKLLRMTQSELAALLGINNVTLSGYETGKHDPKSATLVQIAKICNTTTDFLLGREEKPAPQQEDILYISRPTGNVSTDELRKQLHDLIDQMEDEDLRLMSGLMVKFKRD